MGKAKDILAYTNPITILLGVPIVIGIVLSAMLDGTVRKTKRVLNGMEL